MKRFLLGSVLALSFSLLSCNDNSSSGPDIKEGGGIEVPCNAENEGEVVNPADSDKEYICKNSSWNVVDSSRHCEDCKNEAISISSSSSNNNVILSASDKSSSSIITSVSDESSSSVIASETKQSSSEQSTESSNSEVGDSSSSVETTEDESSSSEEVEDSSSSEETAMFLCDDGVTYVLDLENCETESSSSDNAEESSSSVENGELSSSEVITQSSSSEEKQESSSSVSTSSSSIDNQDKSSSSLGCIYGENIYDERNGTTYKTVVIGNQVWMAENLNFEHSIGEKASQKSTCLHKDENNCDKYGRLYPWTVAIDSALLDTIYNIKCGYKDWKNCSVPEKWKGICPKGWHLPTKAEWRHLISNVGGESVAGKKLKSATLWDGEDAVCFAALPGGRYASYQFYGGGDHAYFWMADFKEQVSGAGAYSIFMVTNYDDHGTISVDLTYNAYSVRCIKN